MIRSALVLGSLVGLVACGGPARAPMANVDAGTTTDAGSSVDSGPSDAGHMDAGPSDAGHIDAGAPDAGDCDGGCGEARTCCAGTCVNLQNNPHHCGACGTECSGDQSYCQGTCQRPPCSVGGCADGGTCCGSACCGAGELCCDAEGPVGAYPVCFTPTSESPTCPQGCAPLCISDREAKRDIVPVNDQEILQSLARMPVSKWTYKEGPAVRHLGPMAQDFHAAFGLGNTDKAYDPIDAHGVAFSSIRALYGMVREQNERIEKLERENEALRKRLSLRSPAR